MLQHHTLLLRIFLQFSYNILAAILRAVGDSAATLYFLIVASVLNVLLDLLFVGVLHWGVAGAAVATNIAQAAAMTAAWGYMNIKYSIFRFRLRDLSWSSREAWATITVGLPITIQLSVVAMGLSFIQRAVNSFGEVMTASFAAGQRIEMYLHLPCNSLNTALATYTGQNIGAGKFDRVRQGARQGTVLSLLLTAILAVPVWFLSGEIVAFFGLSELAAAYCTAHLQAAAFTNIILACYVPLFGVFQGTRHAVIPAAVALLALSLRVFITYSLKDGEMFGHTIIWWNSLFGYSTGCTISWLYYLTGKWLPAERK